MSILLIKASATAIPLMDDCVQCVVTSPPYWGLRKYDGAQELDWNGWRGAYGLEPTIAMYVEHTVEILREIRRVLRPDGVVFWNIGDSYAASTRGSGGHTKKQDSNRGSWFDERRWKIGDGLKPKDLCLIPQRVAIAAQEDGWWVRSDIIWAKPNPMPESCTDRPTDVYEHIIMLTKSSRYYWDKEAVREPGSNKTGRNLRNVWTFPPQPYSGAHFATFPEELPRRCILAATSAKGDCRFCGAPWERVMHRPQPPEEMRNRGDEVKMSFHTQSPGGGQKIQDWYDAHPPTMIGWRPTCDCPGQHGQTFPSIVLDPFGGSGTTGRVALELGRHVVLLDINYCGSYSDLASVRVEGAQPGFEFS